MSAAMERKEPHQYLWRGRPDRSYRSITDDWTPEQRYTLGVYQNEDPEKAKKFAQDVNKYNANSALYAQQDRQKQEMAAMDLDAAKREIDDLQNEVDNFYFSHDYTDDAEYRQKQKELNEKRNIYNQAKRNQ